MVRLFLAKWTADNLDDNSAFDFVFMGDLVVVFGDLFLAFVDWKKILHELSNIIGIKDP